MWHEKSRVGLNGGGTIGKEVLELLEDHPRLELVAVNEVAPVASLVSHLRRRRVGWPLRPVRSADGFLEYGGNRIRLSQENEPAAIPWREAGVDLVVEATGRFTDAAKARGHLEAGAGRVLVSAPAKGADATIVRGVSDDRLVADARVVSAGSCTTNCVAPLLHVLARHFGIECGGFVSVHAATNDQSIGGAPGREAARSFATLDNAFATATGASRAVEEVLPGLAGRLGARAVRVPVSIGSRIELWVALGQEASVASVRAALEAESAGSLDGILELCDEDLAASDIRGSTASCIIEARSLSMTGNRHLMVSAWYDNVSAFSHRVIEILDRMAEETGRVGAERLAAAAV